MGGRIPCVPMERLSHLRVLSDARVDARVAVRLGWIRRVVGDVGSRCIPGLHVTPTASKAKEYND